ncbi:aminotransferase class IV [Hymenobacter swuensis]|nr:aminotransferase class IV [Hymenobacter swuensis]
MLVLYNGELLPADTVRLPLPNRGLYFNDGFFETLVWEPAGLRYLPYHVARMQRAATALSLELPATLASAAALTATVQQLIGTAPEPVQRLRLQLWRSGGGLYAPATTQPDWLLTTQPFAAVETPVLQCDFATTVRTHSSSVSFCKGPNALLYVLAAQERQRRRLDEVILLSHEGYVAETVAAALGWIRQKTIYAPTEAAGGVAGTRLAHLRTTAAALGLLWREGLYEPDELLRAEAVFTANVAGVRAVQQIGTVEFHSATHPLLRRLCLAEATTPGG